MNLPTEEWKEARKSPNPIGVAAIGIALTLLAWKACSMSGGPALEIGQQVHIEGNRMAGTFMGATPLDLENALNAVYIHDAPTLGEMQRVNSLTILRAGIPATILEVRSGNAKIRVDADPFTGRVGWVEKASVVPPGGR